MDIHIQVSSSRIDRMSRRRRKIALSGRPTTVYAGCYPLSVGDAQEVPGTNKVEFEITYRFEFAQNVAVNGVVLCPD